MKFLYLTSTTASSIYDWRWDEHELKDLNENFAPCLICDMAMREHFKSMLSDIRIEMEKRCAATFESKKAYSYITTGSPSHIKELRVVTEQVYNTDNNKYNYFETEQDAKNALNAIKTIFHQYGIDLL